MKIITWNINGYRSVVGQNPSKRLDTVTKENKLFAYIRQEAPDIICLQETKSSPEQIDDNLRCPEGYQAYYNSSTAKKGYSGVVTFTKAKPVSVNTELEIEKFDAEGRIVELEFPEFTIFNVYFPKGYTDDERLDYKLEFYDKIYERFNLLKEQGKKLIVSGDYNTAHQEIDLARPKDNTNTSGFLSEEREKLDELVNYGFVDAFRKINPNGNNYTWWSQRGRARENNIGWRIDYHFITEDLLPKLKNCYIQPQVLGSDHCPVVLELE